MARKLIALAVMLLLASLCGAGSINVQRFVLFSGDTDSTTQVSPWIHVKNADRILLRAFSTHAGFGANADSTKSDSIATFVLIFTDSSTVYGGLTAGAD